jgi:DNA modification methylase
MSKEEFRQFLLMSFISLKHCSKEGALFYLFSDWRSLSDLFYATEEVFSEMLNLCVWNKSNGGMGSLYRSKHELVGVFKHGKVPHTNNVQLGKFGRDRTNVWDYPGVSSFGKDREHALAMHPTVKPVELLKDILLDTSNPHDIVIDGFLGSGSTLMAAEKVHRRCFGVEIDPKYVDVTLQRWMQYSGEEPIHIESGLTFSELTRQRTQDQEVA